MGAGLEQAGRLRRLLRQPGGGRGGGGGFSHARGAGAQSGSSRRPQIQAQCRPRSLCDRTILPDQTTGMTIFRAARSSTTASCTITWALAGGSDQLRRELARRRPEQPTRLPAHWVMRSAGDLGTCTISPLDDRSHPTDLTSGLPGTWQIGRYAATRSPLPRPALMNTGADDGDIATARPVRRLIQTASGQLCAPGRRRLNLIRNCNGFWAAKQAAWVTGKARLTKILLTIYLVD